MFPDGIISQQREKRNVLLSHFNDSYEACLDRRPILVYPNKRVIAGREISTVSAFAGRDVEDRSIALFYSAASCSDELPLDDGDMPINWTGSIRRKRGDRFHTEGTMLPEVLERSLFCVQSYRTGIRTKAAQGASKVWALLPPSRGSTVRCEHSATIDIARSQLFNQINNVNSDFQAPLTIALRIG